MPLYEANGDKQKPIIKDGTGFFSHATCPAVETKTKRPTYIMINQPGAYAFSYENTPTNYITASVIAGDADRGNPAVRLDIQPTAWRQTDSAGVVGDVTFVYVRVG